MKRPLFATALASMLLALSAVHCGPPRQMQPPVIEDTGKKDMAPDEPGPAPAKTATEAAASASAAASPVDADRRVECCAQCKTGLAKDNSGDKPDKIPCAELTSDLNPWCMSWFKKNPLMASECQ
ncbi:MAG: hypothetical protein HY908_01210 [Myxococcales bacterium]|nr:hypothetical protein [Myxococcales bacterium]MCC6526159.1 hypothetical protein [Polyangiaceae bacterium]